MPPNPGIAPVGPKVCTNSQSPPAQSENQRGRLASIR
jgi:hypothetical protein